MTTEKQYTCNLCGQSCAINRHWTGEKSPEDYSYQGIAHGHYSSMALEDMTSYRFCICEYCMDWLFRKFKIPPVVAQYEIVSTNVGFEASTTENERPFVPAAELMVTGHRKDWPPELREEFFKEFLARTKARGDKINKKYRLLYSEEYEKFIHHPGEYEFEDDSWMFHVGDHVVLMKANDESKFMYARVLYIKPGRDETRSLITVSKATKEMQNE